MAAALDSKVELRLIHNLPISDLEGIGLELGISPNTLSVIKKNNCGDENSRKREILGQWLRQDIKASYRKLAEVLYKHDPPEMGSIEKLAKNLGCSVDALIPPGQPVAAPPPAPLKPETFQRLQSKPAPLPLLQCQISTDPPKKSVEAGMGHMLDPEDVDSLFGIVKGAKAKWRDIGRELGFTLKEMDEIVQKKGISQDQDYFQELLDLWLNWAPPQRPFPCTEDLLDALRRIGQHRLALKLENTETIMGMKKLVTRGLQLNPSFTIVSASKPPIAPGNGSVSITADLHPAEDTGITAASKLPIAPGNGSVSIAANLLQAEDTGITAASKLPIAPGNGSVSIAANLLPAEDTGITAASKLPIAPENGSVFITADLLPAEDTDSSAPEVEADSAEPNGSTGSSINLSPTPLDSSAPKVQANVGEEGPQGSTGNVKTPVENGTHTPYLIIKDIKKDHWMVSAGGGRPHKAYKMDKDIHGIALIISNTEFEEDTGINDRDGGDKDEQALQELFETLHYKAVLLKNLKAAQIERALKIVTGQLLFDDLTNRADIKKLENLKAEDCLVSLRNDSFVLCVMSHGEDGDILLGTDGEKFKLHKVYQIVGNCKMLSNKPKMVFIQACRGGGVPQADGDCVEKPADFFTSFPTFTGHAAFRDGDSSGSWYVKDLCSVFKESYISTDLESMVKEVHDKLRDRLSTDGDGEKICQVPEKRDTLRFNVYFQLKESQSIS